ncbi:hypothetical protein [Rhodococcus gannanensis]|uniref:Uncharacterized protein n=1 Tax=Rhodococcus gannanensis TaxID=1960308 RepID=A0ABW4NZ42_9NOCA
MKVGERLKSPTTGVEVIVVKVGDSVEGPLLCAGVPMDPTAAAGGVAAQTAGIGAPLVIGKRYSGAGVEVLCVTPGPGPLSVGSVELELAAPRPLPASD